MYSFLDLIYSQVPRGEGGDRISWFLNGSGTFDVQSYYQVIHGANAHSISKFLLSLPFSS